MQILATTWHVTEGCPPRHFNVTLELGGDRQTRVTAGGRSRLLQWNGRGYKPGSRKMLAAAIEKFLELERWQERHQAERINGAERQLPVGDRA